MRRVRHDADRPITHAPAPFGRRSRDRGGQREADGRSVGHERPRRRDRIRALSATPVRFVVDGEDLPLIPGVLKHDKANEVHFGIVDLDTSIRNVSYELDELSLR